MPQQQQQQQQLEQHDELLWLIQSHLCAGGIT